MARVFGNDVTAKGTNSRAPGFAMRDLSILDCGIKALDAYFVENFVLYQYHSLYYTFKSKKIKLWL